MSPVYDSLVRITLSAEGGSRTFAGTVVAGQARVVEIKGMDLDAPFAPAMLYVNNLDKPGFIGAVGGLLSAANINIATFNLGRTASGGDAICLIGVDQPLTAGQLAEVRGLAHVKEARVLSF